uniref:Reverse transcriptase domain-containing protein n=1 Tax=Amphimedon queenslandica TaxID=400682 RepID=A0A1X7VTP4_AMPQE
MGIITKVDTPMSWCSGMVDDPKQNGSVRICVDLKAINEGVMREKHPLLKIKETVAPMTGARIFSKLDANSGFWLIPLAEESQLLTGTVRKILFQETPIWNLQCPRTFLKANEHHCGRLKGRSESYG